MKELARYKKAFKMRKAGYKRDYTQGKATNLPAITRPPVWKESRKKETLKEFADKREIFSVKMAINYREEKKCLYEAIETAENKLKEKEKRYDENIVLVKG